MNCDIVKEIEGYVNSLEDELISIRRRIHSNPELSFEEFNTMNYVTEKLNEIGVDYTDRVCGTGVVAVVEGAKSKDKPSDFKSVLLRADMDALPIDENTGCEYASKLPGVMHACGHDAHTAILIETCRAVAHFKDRFDGVVKFVFQPGEETTGGAKPMIEAGVMSDPKIDACAALHMDPELEAGVIRTKSGPLYGSPDEFIIKITGKGGHGAEPQNCIDPILIASQIITGLQLIVSRSTDPFENAVVSVCSVHSGNARNVIPDSAVIEGTARSLKPSVREHIERSIEDVVKGVCSIYGAEYEYEFIRLYPPLINDESIAKMICASASKYLPPENVIYGGEATMAGEDFAYFAEKAPSALFKLGCGNKQSGITAPIHSPKFQIDESCLKYGVTIFTDFVLDFLNRRE